MITAVCPGTFDPMTFGHLNIVERGCKLFDRVLVAVAIGTHKSPLFTLEERLQLTRQVLRPHPNVEVLPLTGLLVEFAKQHHAKLSTTP
ncbi:MAG: hypothetical protein EBX40_03465 [Gammaproteobacteria bacterium]|nr:hypothetical protein [Gammaproteobacteria bacterium]